MGGPPVRANQSVRKAWFGGQNLAATPEALIIGTCHAIQLRRNENRPLVYCDTFTAVGSRGAILIEAHL